jgi:hypothetical protein
VRRAPLHAKVSNAIVTHEVLPEETLYGIEKYGVTDGFETSPARQDGPRQAVEANNPSE